MINPHDLNSLVQKPEDEVPDWAWVYDYFLQQGIAYHEFNELPLPYIFMMLKTSNIRQEKKKKEMDT